MFSSASTCSHDDGETLLSNDPIKICAEKLGKNCEEFEFLLVLSLCNGKDVSLVILILSLGKFSSISSICSGKIIIWDKVFKSGPSKVCGRKPLKNLKGYGLLKQTISLQVF